MNSKCAPLVVLVTILCGPVEQLADGKGPSLGIAMRSGRTRRLIVRPVDRGLTPTSPTKSAAPVPPPTVSDDLEFDIPQPPRTMNNAAVGTGVEPKRATRLLRDRLEHGQPQGQSLVPPHGQPKVQPNVQPSRGVGGEPSISERIRERMHGLESRTSATLQSTDQEVEKARPNPRGWSPFSVRKL